MTFKPYQPWYDDKRDYNTNAPSYYDYLANSVNLEKVQTEAINDLLVRDVDFLDSDEIHVDKLTDWHNDDPNHQNKTSFKAHVITSPKTLTYRLDNVDYQASNALKVLDSGLYTPDFSQVISQQTARLNETSTTAKRAETKADNAQKGVDSINSELPSIKSNITSLQSGKQNKLTAGYGIKINNNTITGSVPTVVPETFDLNTLTEGLIKGTNLKNAPDQYWWVVEAFTEGNYTIQNATKMVTSGNYVKTYTRYKQGQTWTVWVEQLTNKNELTEAIKNVNKSYNLQNPEIYSQHQFSPTTNASGNWGFYFFNDTNSKIYNVKLACGKIINATKGTVLAQQNVSDLVSKGVPADFLNKAKNSYIFRVGYYLGNSLKRVALKLQTKSDFSIIEIVLDDFDGYVNTESFVTNTDIVSGHEIVPVAVTYNNAVSIEETGETKPVDDSTNE